MSRYIDADVLFDAMEETEWYNNADRDEIAERLIMDAPTIDIVHCGECKMWMSEHLCQWWSRYGTVETDAADFCSYGEREGE